MTTAPTTVTSPPSPQTAAETLLTRVRQFQRTFNNQAAQPGERMLGLCNALGLMAYPKNQPVLDNLGAEEAQALRQEFLELVLGECGHGNFPRLFAEALGLELPPAPVRAAEEASVEGAEETPDVKRWTRQSVLNWVSTPVTLTPSKPPVYLYSNPHIDVIVQLLGYYGPLSSYQLCALIMNGERVSNRIAPITIIDYVREAIRLLEAKQLVAPRTVSSWNSVNVNLWVLEAPGQIYYAILNDQPTPTTQELAVKVVQLQHAFGTNQVLADMAAVAALTTRLGVCEHIISTVLKENPSLNVANRSGVEIPPVNLTKSLEWARQSKTRKPSEIAGFGCRVEFMRVGTALEIGQTDRKAIVPDGMGKIIYDSDLPISTITQACNLTGDEAQFPGSGTSGRHYWPFILEYDRATETSEFFAEKVEAYSRFYNTVQTAWPVEWGNRFPTILVVGEGSPVHLITLMAAIRMALAKIKQNNPATKRLGNWWFTSADWFHGVYKQYLETETLTNWGKQIYPSGAKLVRGRKPKAEVTKSPVRLTLSPDPHIWLPLDKKIERYDVMSISNYVAGEISQLPKIMKELKALPLPAVLNQLVL